MEPTNYPSDMPSMIPSNHASPSSVRSSVPFIKNAKKRQAWEKGSEFPNKKMHQTIMLSLLSLENCNCFHVIAARKENVTRGTLEFPAAASGGQESVTITGKCVKATRHVNERLNVVGPVNLMFWSILQQHWVFRVVLICIVRPRRGGSTINTLAPNA
eukprot:scaffold29255_cov37-Attheya_sp.AAC.1